MAAGYRGRFRAQLIGARKRTATASVQSFGFSAGIGRLSFDAVIAMRNAMYAGDQEALGGKVLGSIDGAIDNVSMRLAENGARYERAETVLARLNAQIPNVTSADPANPIWI